MPAAKRYKQSLIDEIKEALRELPPGNPPEPEVTTREALEQLKEELHRKIADEHVDIEAIVEMLNARGFAVGLRDVRKVALPKVSRPKKASAAKSTPPRSRSGGKRGTATNAPARGPAGSGGSFTVKPDDKDI